MAGERQTARWMCSACQHVNLDEDGPVCENCDTDNFAIGERQTEPHQAGPFGVPAAGDFHCGRCGTLLDGGTDEPVAARELRAELANQVVEIVALIRSYADVHMTKALADLIEHKYIRGKERST